MPATTRKAKKVLFISADQMRADCLSAVGHPLVKTPNLDKLAADGVLFRKHYTQIAPCGPARTSLLTGLYAMNHRSVRNSTPLDARHSNIALEVRKGGYEPVLIGYTDTSLDPRQRSANDPDTRRYQGLMPGFSEVVNFNEEVPYPWIGQLLKEGYSVPDELFDIYLPQPDYPGTDTRGHAFAPPVYRAEHSDTAFMADQVLDYIRPRRQQPWFVHLVFLRPHPPLYAPEPYNSMYHPDQVEMPMRVNSLAEEQRQHPWLAQWLENQSRPGSYGGHNLNVRDLPAHELRQMRATYYGLISEVDHHIGRLIDYLKASGEYDDTLIIFTCDHGEMLGDHWLWGKGGYFDASYHVPLIIRAPEAESSRDRQLKIFSEAVDIMPTILDWLDLPIPVQCDGESLMPWIRGDKPSRWRSAVHWEFDFRETVTQQYETALNLTSDQCTLNVIRDDHYKYVHFSALPPLLFDLRDDPHEFYNYAEKPDCQSEVLKYAQQLLSLRMIHAERTLSNSLLTADGVVSRQDSRYL